MDGAKARKKVSSLHCLQDVNRVAGLPDIVRLIFIVTLEVWFGKYAD